MSCEGERAGLRSVSLTDQELVDWWGEVRERVRSEGTERLRRPLVLGVREALT